MIATLLAIETLIAVVAWTILTASWVRTPRRRPTAEMLVLLIAWATILANGARSLELAGVVNSDTVSLFGAMARGILALVGVGFVLGRIGEKSE